MHNCTRNIQIFVPIRAIQRRHGMRCVAPLFARRRPARNYRTSSNCRRNPRLRRRGHRATSRLRRVTHALSGNDLQSWASTAQSRRGHSFRHSHGDNSLTTH